MIKRDGSGANALTPCHEICCASAKPHAHIGSVGAENLAGPFDTKSAQVLGSHASAYWKIVIMVRLACLLTSIIERRIPLVPEELGAKNGTSDQVNLLSFLTELTCLFTMIVRAEL